MKIQLLSFLLVFGLCSCGTDTATSSDKSETTEAADQFSPADVAAQTKAFENMMNLHDRVMPKMGNIAQMQKMLKDEMAKTDTPDPKLEAVNTTLESAYDGMMSWMRNMKSMDELREMGSQDKIMAYVKGEEMSMAKIEGMIETGMKEGYALLGIEPPAMNGDGHDHDGHGHDHDHGDHDHDHGH